MSYVRGEIYREEDLNGGERERKDCRENKAKTQISLRMYLTASGSCPISSDFVNPAAVQSKFIGPPHIPNVHMKGKVLLFALGRERREEESTGGEREREWRGRSYGVDSEQCYSAGKSL